MSGFFTKKETESKTRPDGRNLSCISCGLYKNCNSPRMNPYGEFKKGIMVVGEAPGEIEDSRGKPFQGKTGKLLQRTLAKYGIDLFEDCVSLNSVNCRPEDNRTPSTYEMDCCRSVKVTKAIEQYKPKIIIVLGGSALYSIIGNRWKKELGGITKWRGFCIPDQDLHSWVCPVFHPSFVERDDTGVAQVVWENDLQEIFKLIEDKVPFPIYKKPKIEIIDDLQILDTIKSTRIAFDYETTGLKPHGLGQEIVCCSIAPSSNMAYSFMMPSTRIERMPFIRLLRNPLIEKMAHNCLHARSLVLMADGSKKYISYLVNNKIKDPVLCFNTKTKKIEEKPIINWYKEEDSKVIWKKVITKNSINGKQSHCLTNDHKVYTIERGMVKVDDLKIGENLLIKKEGLSDIQLQLILGSGLGDGSIVLNKKNNKAKNAYFVVTHGEKQEQYIKWKRKILNNISDDVKKKNNNKGFSRKDGISYAFHTKSLPEITPLRRQLYSRNGKKIITETYLNKLEPLALAVWYMDDGSVYKTNMNLHIAGYSETSCEKIIEYFAKKYEIYFRLERDSFNKPRTLHLGKKAGGYKFCELIAPYIHDDLKYKIPKYYKKEVGKLVNKVINSQKNYTQSEITDIIDSVPRMSKKIKFCIEVPDNHNFFTTMGLVSNCKYEETWSAVKLRQPVKNWIWDTMLAAHIFDNRPGITNLKIQTYLMFGIIDYASEVSPYLEGVGEGGNSLNRIKELLKLPGGKVKVLTYCGYDSVYQYRLAELQMSKTNFDLPF
jgi:uracil-DNA glycosylase family 4